MYEKSLQYSKWILLDPLCDQAGGQHDNSAASYTLGVLDRFLDRKTAEERFVQQVPWCHRRLECPHAHDHAVCACTPFIIRRRRG